jgi:hypothetical protein
MVLHWDGTDHSVPGTSSVTPSIFPPKKSETVVEDLWKVLNQEKNSHFWDLNISKHQAGWWDMMGHDGTCPKSVWSSLHPRITAKIKFITPREIVVIMKNMIGAVQGLCSARGTEMELHWSPATILVQHDSSQLVKISTASNLKTI